MKKIIILIIAIISFGNATEIMNGGNSSISNILNQKEGPISKKKNYKELVPFLEKSNNGEYTFYLAILYLKGSVTPDEFGNVVLKDTTKALKFFKKSIDLEYYQSASVLGSLYIYNEDFMTMEDNVKKGKHYLTLAIKNEIYEASTALASLYFYYDKDADKGLETLMIGADKGISTAQLVLATTFAYGLKDINIQQNKAMANKFLEMACLNKNKTKEVIKFCNSKNVKHRGK